MAKTPDFNETAAHKWYAVQCFNDCWDLIDKEERTPEEEEEMLRRTMASHFHWTHRADYAPVKASLANWQVARVLALMGEAGMAMRYGERALAVLEDEEAQPFYLGYGYEAVARAAAVGGDAQGAREFLKKGRELAALVVKEQDRKWLEADLDGVAALLG